METVFHFSVITLFLAPFGIALFLLMRSWHRIGGLPGATERVFKGVQGPPATGLETIVGKKADLLEATKASEDGLTHLSRVRIRGETWTVRVPEPCAAGREVRVVQAGTILDVVLADVS